jgi:DNA polymerase III subunit epsilon
VLAIGTVPIVSGVVHVGAATSTLVRPANRSAVEGITAHHLRPSEVAAAPTLAAALPDLLEAIGEAQALLVHHASLDIAVLRRACAATGRAWPTPAVIDTVDLILRVRRQQRSTGGGRRLPRDLAGARQAMGLPSYPAHDARLDAIATAELYLALQARLTR